MDDWTYESTFKDVTTVRYVLDKWQKVNSFFPGSHSQQQLPYFAHSAAGRDQREYHLGTNFGRRLDPLIPKAVHSRLSIRTHLSKRVGIAPNRSNVEFQLGYFLTR